MLADVGQALGHDVVDGHLDRLGQPLGEVDPQVDRHRRPGGHRLERHREPAAGEQRRLQPVRQVAQLVDGRADLLPGVVDPSRDVRVGAQAALDQGELDRERDQPLLGAVVQVALQALPLALRRPR